MGLKESERIANILVDPRDGNTVYACVPGKLWSDSEERGLFKTTDGGKSWAKILKGSNLSTGCSMVSMSSRDPNTLYAGMWDFRRQGLDIPLRRRRARRLRAKAASSRRRTAAPPGRKSLRTPGFRLNPGAGSRWPLLLRIRMSSMR